jgi:hypothetical protein
MERLISRLDKALNQQKKVTAVFDIDSTIFDVTPRNQEILNLFLHREKGLKTKHKLQPFEWGIERFLNKELSEEFKKEAKKFWRRHFFSGTFLQSDRPYIGSIDFVKSLRDLGAEILYLTGRDTERMRAGSLKQLKYWKLPLESDEDLFTKPNKGMPDGPYKSMFLEKIIQERPNKEILFFDNEPVVLNHCLFNEVDNYKAFFIDSTHSNRMQPESQWPKISVDDYLSIADSLKQRVQVGS